MKTFFLALCASALADEVELTDGTVIEGTVQDLGDSIKITRSSGSVTYPRHMILKITPKKTVEEIYKERSDELKDGDVEGRLKLARWCVDKKLQREAVDQFRKVLDLQADHEEARLGAGFRNLDGKWITDDEFHEARGLVRHKGRWTTPEQRDLDLALEEQKEIDREIHLEVKNLVEQIRSHDEKKRDRAATSLAKIEDQYKKKAFLGAITSSSREVRKFVFEELGRMKESAAARQLVRRSIWDEDKELRPVAFNAVVDINHPDSALLYLPFLAEESISARIRCLDALASFKDLRAVPALAEALENNLETLKVYEQYGQQMTVVTGRTVILRDGRKITIPKVVRIRMDSLDKDSKALLQTEKARILSTLGAITGKSLGEDPDRWRKP